MTSLLKQWEDLDLYEILAYFSRFYLILSLIILKWGDHGYLQYIHLEKAEFSFQKKPPDNASCWGACVLLEDISRVNRF